MGVSFQSVIESAALIVASKNILSEDLEVNGVWSMTARLGDAVNIWASRNQRVKR